MTGRTMALAVCLVALMGASAMCGYLFARKGGAEDLGVARGDARSCVDSAAAVQAALDETADKLSTLRTDHQAFLGRASSALLELNAQNAALASAGAVTSNTIKEIARADPDCAALTLLPLCPAIAVELWPAPAQADRAKPAGRD